MPVPQDHQQQKALPARLDANYDRQQGSLVVMKRRGGTVLATLLAGLLLSLCGWAQAGQVVEYLSVPGPVKINGLEYRLAWSSHPNPRFYKQEYVPQGQSVERFDDMFMIDVLTDNASPVEMATEMAGKLAALKQDNPVVNFDLLISDDGKEALLDFLMSATGSDGIQILEWNAYRYRPHGETGAVVYAVSRRAYGEDMIPFLRDELKAYRQRVIDELGRTELPEIRVSLQTPPAQDHAVPVE